MPSLGSLLFRLEIILFLSFLTCYSGLSQHEQDSVVNRDTLIAAAREIMQVARYCALTSLDSTGQPHTRTMDPFPPEDDMVVWLATNPKSRKVAQIKKDHRVSLSYLAPDASGYVTISGMATLINDESEKITRWKDGWEAFYPDRKGSYLLIKVTPQRLEVVSYTHGIVGDEGTWEVPAVRFE